MLASPMHEPAHRRAPLLKTWALILLGVAGTLALQAQWVQQKSGTSTNLADVVAIDSATAIAVGRDGSILKTTDAGRTWLVLPLEPLFFHPWNAISFSDNRMGNVAGDFGRVASTTDGGEHWLWSSVPGGRNCLSVLQLGAGYVLAGDDSGWVHRSLDTGRTWSSERVSTWPIRSLFAGAGISIRGLPLYALTPFSLCARAEFPPSPWNERILQPFQGLGSEAYRGAFCSGGGPGFIVGVQGDLRAAPAIVRRPLTDTGWATIQTGLKGDGTLYGVSAPSGKIVYVCGDQGFIFSSSDGGDAWSAAEVPTKRRLRAISFSDEAHGFAVGDSGTILHTSNGGATAVGEGDNPFVTGFALRQNFPNPFNPRTTIGYRIPYKEFVTMKVFDILGRAITSLVDERKDPGMYATEFDGTALPSGVYLCRMTAGAFVETRMLVLLR